MKIRVPLIRELTMLALGSVGMARELFLVPPAEFSYQRMAICLGLMLGPAAIWLIWRPKQPTDESGSPGPPSPSPVSSSHSPG